MARNLKLNIKNAQLAEAFKLSSLKTRAGQTKPSKAEAPSKASEASHSALPQGSSAGAEPLRAPGKQQQADQVEQAFSEQAASANPAQGKSQAESSASTATHSSIARPLAPPKVSIKSPPSQALKRDAPDKRAAGGSTVTRRVVNEPPAKETSREARGPSSIKGRAPKTTSGPTGHRRPMPKLPPGFKVREPEAAPLEGGALEPTPGRARLGPTGKHVDDYLQPQVLPEKDSSSARTAKASEGTADLTKAAVEGRPAKEGKGERDSDGAKGKRPAKAKESGKVQRKASSLKSIDTYLKGRTEERAWRKPRHKASKTQAVPQSAVPATLAVRLPISVKDLASEMKLKASQLIAQLFMQGITLTLNDLIEDDTLISVLGSHFNCEIRIDTSREERLAVTDKSVDQEIAQSPQDRLTPRAPVVTFMGHVDHGKTSLVDAIRHTNRAAHEAGAITQHIGAFSCSTSQGPVTILDTPGHAAFSEMRARGAKVTDLVVLVVAGDEGIMEQTREVIDQARSAGATLLVAVNKSDRENFDLEKVYRQLADLELLPEAWGGTVVTVACSAKTGEGIQELLELIALQAEILELQADFQARARGVVIEVQMHKGLGPLATVLVQNGTLQKTNALVFEDEWGRIRNMRDETGSEIATAGPSTPVAITGLSGLPSAGEQFICVGSEREAREIIEGRRLMGAARATHKRRLISDAILTGPGAVKKVLNLIVRADVNGSLEAVKTALSGIRSEKVDINVIAEGVGEVSESDVLLAAASKAIVLGFHTQVESHAELLIKQRAVNVQMFDLIYHLVDGIRVVMTSMLDKIRQENDRGAAEIRAVFRSSKLGNIAGCIVTEGLMNRNFQVRVVRAGQVLHKGPIASIKRGKEDVREVAKGIECGILLERFSELQAGDLLQSVEVTYLSQEL